MCRRFGCTPDEAYAMDAGVIRLLKIEELGGARVADTEGGEV